MRKLLFSLTFLFVTFGCKKHHDCTDAIVTLKAVSCNNIGIIINSKIYPTDDLPNQYAVEGQHICIEYTLFEDMRMCVCCGGTHAHIIKVH